MSSRCRSESANRPGDLIEEYPRVSSYHMYFSGTPRRNKRSRILCIGIHSVSVDSTARLGVFLYNSYYSYNLYDTLLTCLISAILYYHYDYLRFFRTSLYCNNRYIFLGPTLWPVLVRPEGFVSDRLMYNTICIM